MAKAMLLDKDYTSEQIESCIEYYFDDQHPWVIAQKYNLINSSRRVRERIARQAFPSTSTLANRTTSPATFATPVMKTLQYMRDYIAVGCTFSLSVCETSFCNIIPSYNCKKKLNFLKLIRMSWLQAAPQVHVEVQRPSVITAPQLPHSGTPEQSTGAVGSFREDAQRSPVIPAPQLQHSETPEQSPRMVLNFQDDAQRSPPTLAEPEPESIGGFFRNFTRFFR